MPTCLPEIVPLSAGPPSETNHLRMRCTRLTLWCRGRLRGQFRLGGSFETVATFCSQSLGIAMRSKHGVASDRLLWHRRHPVRAAVATSDNHDGGPSWKRRFHSRPRRSTLPVPHPPWLTPSRYRGFPALLPDMAGHPGKDDRSL